MTYYKALSIYRYISNNFQEFQNYIRGIKKHKFGFVSKEDKNEGKVQKLKRDCRIQQLVGLGDLLLAPTFYGLILAYLIISGPGSFIHLAVPKCCCALHQCLSLVLN